MNNKFYQQAIKELLILCAVLALCRITKGAFVIVVVITALWAAHQEKFGLAICCYIMMPLMIVVNHTLLPKTGPIFMPLLRFGPLLVGLGLVIAAAKRQGKHRMPFGAIIPFLLAAYISSAGGYAPKISYLKIINYFIFLLGIWLGTQNLQNRPKDINIIRTFFFAIAIFLVLGSLALRPFPAISYATGLQDALVKGGAEYATMVFREMEETGMKTLFCGITVHSQALAPLLAITFAWVMCDMLFVEKRFRWGHLVILILIPPMLYMTRSRVGFVTFVADLVMIYFYAIMRIRIAPQVKQRLGTGFLVLAALAVVVLGIAQVRNQTVSKWLRKDQDVEGDTRTLAEAVTQSRMSLIEESMRDFRRNPLFGSGFQVAWHHEALARKPGLVLSASIEKGVLPIMVLGETGIFGAVCFVFFLFAFYLTATKRKLYVTITLFTILLVTNLGEASFFSPGGGGGFAWILTVVGGFVIDTVLLYERTMARKWGRMMQGERGRLPAGQGWASV